MKSILSMIIAVGFLLTSACSATPTKDLNIHNLRVVDIKNYDTSIVATFCGTENFNKLFIAYPYPKIYTKLKTTENYLDFKSSHISEFDPVKYKIWIGDVDLEKFPEYRNCGKGKIYPYIYWFNLNVEKDLPYKKSRKEDYMNSYNEFRQQIINTREIELGVVQLSGFNGNDSVSEETSFLKLNDEQYNILIDKIR